MLRVTFLNQLYEMPFGSVEALTNKFGEDLVGIIADRFSINGKVVMFGDATLNAIKSREARFRPCLSPAT